MILIPMAGSSIRFKKSGFMKPKWTIKIGEYPMLYYSIQSVRPLMFPKERIVLVLLKSEENHLKKITTELGMADIEAIFIEEPTPGQAVTALIGLQQLAFNPNERLLIWCSDAYIKNSVQISGLSYQNRIYVSKLSGDQWSFAEVENGNVIRTSEKNRISDLASVGLYEFKSIQDFLNLQFIKYGKQDEIYIAPLYNQLITNNSKIYYQEINKQNYFSFGTPLELMESATRLGLNSSFY